jgi:S-ribosylhomocysteine lyase LuxS involved in autoinducer biosynthesis
MKIRFTKASGVSMELSDIHRIEVVEAGLVKIVRHEPLDAPEKSFRFEPNGAGTGIYIYDVNISWPGPYTVIG